MSARVNDGGPAFPCAFPEMGGGMTPGMSLHDWFAGQAMVGIMNGSGKITVDGVSVKATPENIAAAAYTVADAMLAARGGAK